MQDLLVPGLEARIGFWMSRSQYEHRKRTHLTVDVVPGSGSGFSVEAPEGVRFLIRPRLMDEEELTAFDLLSPRTGHRLSAFGSGGSARPPRLLAATAGRWGPLRAPVERSR